ncbi:MAG: 1-hydroxycarotenoid 3,4-desaturase CrtD [Pseudomonadota bacterium]
MDASSPNRGTIVIGAGMGGLAAALRLAGAGHDVEVLEAAPGPGGKLRAVPSDAGPVDTGPTVLTLLPYFQGLFADSGLDFASYVTVRRQHLLARHWWPDGSSLDLFDDTDASADAIRAFAGAGAEDEFRRFTKDTERLFHAFESPVMQAPELKGTRVAAAALTRPAVLPWLRPGRTLWQALSKRFSDPRLVQLFARYATYVGGSPFQSPALLALIWQAEQAGVWCVDGGMTALARGIERAATDKGAGFHYNAPVARLERDGRGFRVHLQDGSTRTAGQVLFNGDPGALARGLLGEAVTDAVAPKATTPRALSAWVWAFAATPHGRDLAHHNVFFNTHYRREFRAADLGRMPDDAALYVCAQDRGDGKTPPDGSLERFEIILNGAACDGSPCGTEDQDACRIQTFQMLGDRGLTFSPVPERAALTTPSDFARAHPGSDGSLYGRSPHGMTASFQRPTVKSLIPGLYLAGGGVHPGAGLPMALTSGRRAAEAILNDLASTSRSRRTDTRGGMSMGSRMTEPAVSRSLPS